MLEKVCHGVQPLKVYSFTPLPVHSLYFMFAAEDVVAQIHTLAILCHVSPTIMDPLSAFISKNILFLPEFTFDHGVFL